MTMSGRKAKPFLPGAMFMDQVDRDEPMPRRPWGVHTIFDIYSPNVQANWKGKWVAAPAVAYPGYFSERLRAAWWVLTGRAHAILWPQAGDLELALTVRDGDSSSASDSKGKP